MQTLTLHTASARTGLAPAYDYAYGRVSEFKQALTLYTPSPDQLKRVNVREYEGADHSVVYALASQTVDGCACEFDRRASGVMWDWFGCMNERIMR